MNSGAAAGFDCIYISVAVRPRGLVSLL